MKRKEFLQKSLSAGLFLTAMPIVDLMAFNKTSDAINLLNPSEASLSAQNKLSDVLNWMKAQGWSDYLKKTLNVNLDTYSPDDLIKPLSNINDIKKVEGLEDFGGNALIKSGSPTLSLLYHMLASPRVHSTDFKSYPSIEVIDKLEDYIFDLVDLKRDYPNKKNLQLAVLAYEYRPAYKAPPFDQELRTGNEFAQLVYSRSGISRVGSFDYHYDAESRSFTNLPKEKGQEKQIAVMPARYALFVIELVEVDSILLMNEQDKEYTNSGQRHFINPLKKISQNSDVNITFGEYHLNEKLKRLSEYTYDVEKIRLNGNFDIERSPFVRVSSTDDSGKKGTQHQTDEEMITLTREGSSILVGSVPRTKIVRKAKQDGQLISFAVPKIWKKGNPKYKKKFQDNRRYGALKLPNRDGHEFTNVLLSEIIGRRNRRTTGFKAPKIAPLFANIKYNYNDGDVVHIDGTTYAGSKFDNIIEQGNYNALMLEDSICDGCVSAKIEACAEFSKNNEWTSYIILPAFSLITAPDFFPLIDSNDIRNSYRRDWPKLNTDQDFFEGGSLNLSGIRQRGNPLIFDPFTGKRAFEESFTKDKSFDTLTSIIGNSKPIDQSKSDEFTFNFDRDYQSSSFLPDTGTGVFYPGWDITYSGKQVNPYFSTFGLGSPFPEDMKLCAAINGMWPVTSPDAARTFQGSLTFTLGKRPNTTIPLMDKEIGLNKNSPHVKLYNETESFGWDGEQGPYFQIENDQLKINYTDIERADYIQNLLDDDIGFNMESLRDLDSRDVIERMDAQRFCIKCIDRKKVWKTKLWLVAAQKIENWNKEYTINCLPKHPLFDSLNYQRKQNSNMEGSGFFFVYALPAKYKKVGKGTPDPNDDRKKRMLINCETFWICQISTDNIAYVKVKLGKKNTPKWKLDYLV